MHAIKMIGVYGTQVSETEALRLFALGNDEGDGMLYKSGFCKALKVIERTYAKKMLKAVKFDASKLGKDFFLALLCLLLMFFFIFMGIEGFTSGGAFGAVVNSVLPIVGGGMTGDMSSMGPSEEFMGKMKEMMEFAIGQILD